MRASVLLPLLATVAHGFAGNKKDISFTDAKRAANREKPAWHQNQADINALLQKDSSVITLPCESFALAELNDVFRAISAFFAPTFQELYSLSNDTRALRHPALSNFEDEWREAELRVAASKEALAETDALRAGRCAEIAMAWVHHISETARDMLKALGVKIPLLADFELLTDSEKHSDKTKDLYASQYTCVDGHNNGEDNWNSSSGSYADGWPAEITYNATGHGPYPFWLGRVDADISEGAPIQVWWSRTKKAEKFYHPVCAIGNAGYSESYAPCYQLMLEGDSYFYTATEDFCCQSGSSDGQGQQQVLTAVQFDWFKQMTYNGLSDFSGDYYTGQVKNYTMDCSEGCGPGNFYIWYYTDLDDKPIEQGEGCQVMPRTSACQSGGSYLYHNYDPDSWTETSIDASTFEIPSVCKASTNKCMYP